MKPRSRRDRRKTCRGKTAYATAEMAWKAATVMKHKTGMGWRYNAYKCRYCGNYHIGHAPRRYAFN